MIIKYLTLATILIANVSIALSQVTIGNTDKPITGALLQLKNKTEDPTTGSNADKGMMLPRVQLTNKKALYPMFEETALSASPNKDYKTSLQKKEEDLKHIGLVSYNVRNGFYDMCKGLYVWNGENWSNLAPYKSSKEKTQSNTVTDRDGNTYSTASFGDAGIWMTENLRTKTNACGEEIIENISVNKINQFIAFPNNIEANYTNDPVYGLLYNYPAATNGKAGLDGALQPTSNELNDPNEEPVQGICPNGWHIPTNYEWNVLLKELYENSSLYSNVPTNGRVWDNDWNTTTSSDPEYLDKIGSPISTIINSNQKVNGKQTNGESFSYNSNGFDVYSVGRVCIHLDDPNIATNPELHTNNYGIIAYFWTSSRNISNNNQAWVKMFFNSDGGFVTRPFSKGHWRFSIRCKKD